MSQLSCISDLDSWVTTWDGNIVELFAGGECTEVFLKIDPAVLKAKFLSTSWAPEGWLDSDMADIEAADEAAEEEGGFFCNLLDSEGKKCETWWPNKRALGAHQRFALGGEHGSREHRNRCLLSNRCLWCGTVLANRITAMHHMDSAAAHYCCRVDRNRSVYPLAEPADLNCPLCDDDLFFESFDRLEEHLCTVHCPPPADHQLEFEVPHGEGYGILPKVWASWTKRRAAKCEGQAEHSWGQEVSQ